MSPCPPSRSCECSHLKRPCRQGNRACARVGISVVNHVFGDLSILCCSFWLSPCQHASIPQLTSCGETYLLASLGVLSLRASIRLRLLRLLAIRLTRSSVLVLWLCDASAFSGELALRLLWFWFTCFLLVGRAAVWSVTLLAKRFRYALPDQSAVKPCVTRNSRPWRLVSK